MTQRIIAPKGPSLAKAGLSRQTGWGKLKYPSGRQSTLEYDILPGAVLPAFHNIPVTGIDASKQFV